MIDVPESRRPALLPAIAVLLGVAFGSEWATDCSWAVVAIVATTGALLLRVPRGRRAFLLLAFAAAGAWSGSRAWDLAHRRAAGWLPADGSATEVSLVGTVLRAPERDPRGEWWLRIAARPEPDPAPGAGAALVRLVVRAGASAGEVPDLRRGDQIRVHARLRASRGPNPRDDALARLAWGWDASGSVKSARLVERLRAGIAGPERAIDLLLASARGRLDRGLGPDDPARAVAAAMLLGDRASMDPDGLRALRDSGLFHLLAISGLNVGLLVGAALFVVRRTRIPFWLATILAGPALAAFGVLVGADAPVTRACAAAGVALFGRTLGREGDPLNTLALVAAALAFADPASVFHPGFQLTFAATAALVVAARPAAEAIPAPRPLAYALGASAAAYVATAPILAWHFGRLAPVALLSNLAAGPLCAGILGSGCAVLAAGDAPVVGTAAAGALRTAVALLDRTARLAAAVPGATARVASPPPWLLVAVIVLLFVAWRLSRPGHGRVRARLARAGALAGVIALHLGPPPRAPLVAEVAVLDVGQGQAVAVRGPAGECILLDGGGSAGGRYDAGERIVAPWLAAWGCRRLEAVVLSHAHDDHVGGLGSILREFDVGSLWIAAGGWRDEAARDLAALAAERRVALRLASSGSRMAAGSLRLEFLHPSPDDAALGINDRCAVARIVTQAGTALLVPGDLERAGEERALGRGARLEAQALVVGHHGASASTSDRWLSAVGSRLAVVSVGEGNRFGHPAPATLSRLRRARVVTFRTDRDGTVVLREESGGWRVGDGPVRGRTGTGPG